jgi:hypothetical protein
VNEHKQFRLIVKPIDVHWHHPETGESGTTRFFDKLEAENFQDTKIEAGFDAEIF